MKPGLSTHLFERVEPDREVLSLIQRSGFDIIEVWAMSPHVRYEDRHRVKRLAGDIESLGMSVNSIHAPFYIDQRQESWFSISELDDDKRQKWLSEIERAASALAEEMEYEFLVVHAGTWREDHKEDAQWAEAMDRSLTRLYDFCRETGIKLALENIDTRFATTRNIRRVIERFDPEIVGICLDTNHANLNEDPVEAVDVCGNRLFTLHLSDNFGDGDDHKLPFQGGIDWYRFVEALHRNGYEGVFMMELRNYGDMADTLSQARESFEKLEAHDQGLSQKERTYAH